MSKSQQPREWPWLVVALVCVVGSPLAAYVARASKGPKVVVFFGVQLVVQALAFSISRTPKRVKELLGAWLLIISFVFILSAPILQVVVPHVLAAQSPATMSLARIWCFTLAFSLYGDVFSGVMLGDSRYLLFNVVRFLPVGISCALYIGLAVAGKLTLFSALIALAVGSVISLLVGSSAVLIRHRPVWPRQGIAGSTFWYGLRSHGNSIGTIANARLDLLILPAFLASDTVGLYSVASNVSWIVVAIAGAISYIVLPQATRLGSHGAKTVFSALRWTFITAATLALVIALAARPVIDYAYGSAFDGLVIPLLVMLPGSLCSAPSFFVLAVFVSLPPPGPPAGPRQRQRRVVG